mgnify:CR=1 FL=1
MTLLRYRLTGGADVAWPQQADGNRFFDLEAPDVAGALRGDARVNSRSRNLVVYMAPATFLKLAMPMQRGWEKDTSTKLVEKLLAEGKPFSSLPTLYLTLEKGNLDTTVQVKNHEGRHRAAALHAQGVEEMPVGLAHEALRWARSAGPYDFTTWPDSLLPQQGYLQQASTVGPVPAGEAGITPALRRAVQDSRAA